MRRPLVAKVHRDLLLEPKNDSAGVSELGEGWKGALRKLLKNYVIIAIGYGGNDGSLMGLLDQVEPEDFAGKILWCYREKDGGPDQRVLELLTAKKGVTIPIAGFDELMLLLNEKLGFPLQADEIEKQAKVRASTYRKSFQEIQERVTAKPGTSEEKKEVSEAVAKLVQRQSGWWGWELKAASESDPEKRQQIYRAGLKEFENGPELMCVFANFLTKARKNPDEAEALYRRALELAPGDADMNANFASLNLARGKISEAKKIAERAWPLCAKDSGQAAAEVALYRGLISRIEQRDDTPALGRLKTMLASGFQRGQWSFDDVLALAADKLSADDTKLYTATAAAILDADKAAVLEEFPR